MFLFFSSLSFLYYSNEPCTIASHNYLDWVVKINGWTTDNRQSAGEAEEENADIIE